MGLEKVGAAEFKQIVADMKPTIGLMGGRYFKTAKSTYTMNQIINRYFELIDARALTLYGQEGGLILEKDKEATALLEKASCFQKHMTAVKQKWGNRIFKSRHSKFIGKKGAFDMIEAALSLVNGG